MLIPQRESDHVEQDARRVSGMWFHKEKQLITKWQLICQRQRVLLDMMGNEHEVRHLPDSIEPRVNPLHHHQ